MRRRIFWIFVGAPLALVTLAAGTAAALPTTRHIASALWNLPDRLPALPENSQIHFEPGAEGYAREVAGLLPAAIARIEAAQGRPFAHPVIVGVYATPDAYMAANVIGSMQPVATAPFGRVVLSPVLGAQQHRRLPAILTHEMSHAHLQSWMSAYAFVRLPNWFKEGLAVMVSDGGGAEFVNEAEARAAIERGEHIDINDSGSIFNLSDVRFEQGPPPGTRSHQIVTAYRQAGMFVAWLHDSDAPGFGRMMGAILNGSAIVEAVDVGYHQDVRSLWQKFAETGATRK